MNDFPQVLSWLVTGGAVAVGSWFVSWLLEDFGWWNQIKSQYKKLMILLASLLIGVGATWLQLHPERIAALRPYLDMAVLVMIAWIASQVAHKADAR
jgi:hypothetical protein